MPEALIAEVYLAGMNTAQARRALATSLKDQVSQGHGQPGIAQVPLGLAGLAGA